MIASIQAIIDLDFRLHSWVFDIFDMSLSFF